MAADKNTEVDAGLVAAAQACVDHARDLLRSARLLLSSGLPHISYHLAALSIEELGRRELLKVRSVAARRDTVPSWMERHAQSHVQKLLWAFFGAGFSLRSPTQQQFESMRDLARSIHEQRLRGLYVDSSADGISIPSLAINEERAKNLIDLAAAQLGMAEAEAPRTEISKDDLDLQEWFLMTVDDPEKVKRVFSKSSMAKLAELNESKAWAQWLRAEFDKAEAEGRSVLEQELKKGPERIGKPKKKDKWRLRVRIYSNSHSIRPKVLNDWNRRSDWIKLVPVSNKKRELIIEFLLGDNVPIQGLWDFGWGLARHFVTALNIGTMGFWWWRLPQQVSRYYEEIEDLERRGMLVRVERSPILKVDWGENRALSTQDLALVSGCFLALPSPNERTKHPPYGYYIGGLTLLSLNDIHWQCEAHAFGNFFKCLQEMMLSTGAWQRSMPFEGVFGPFLDEFWPGFDERERFMGLCRAFDREPPQSEKVNLREASFMKLFCDTYFLSKIRPTAIKEKVARANAERIDENKDAKRD